MLDLMLSEYAPPLQAGDVVDEGGSLGPRTLLNAGLLPSLSRTGVNVTDAAVIPGGLPDSPEVAGMALDQRQRRLFSCTRQLAERIDRSITQGHLPLILGDCTAGVGAFAGLKRRWDDVAVIVRVAIASGARPIPGLHQEFPWTQR
ncbi:MAG: hypothetical protein HPY55_01310 [Firmicutes bacterium]|nr:hypothetical protein [Bacillota bacterium]